ncbi:MAG: hypothetical protein HQK49_00910 [Oligoflexia bacterium]|nr:hypothetical protein [Oligoflexia bacterium]
MQIIDTDTKTKTTKYPHLLQFVVSATIAVTILIAIFPTSLLASTETVEVEKLPKIPTPKNEKDECSSNNDCIKIIKEAKKECKEFKTDKTRVNPYGECLLHNIFYQTSDLTTDERAKILKPALVKISEHICKNPDENNLKIITEEAIKYEQGPSDKKINLCLLHTQSQTPIDKDKKNKDCVLSWLISKYTAISNLNNDYTNPLNALSHIANKLSEIDNQIKEKKKQNQEPPEDLKLQYHNYLRELMYLSKNKYADFHADANFKYGPQIGLLRYKIKKLSEEQKNKKDITQGIENKKKFESLGKLNDLLTNFADPNPLKLVTHLNKISKKAKSIKLFKGPPIDKETWKKENPKQIIENLGLLKHQTKDLRDQIETLKNECLDIKKDPTNSQTIESKQKLKANGDYIKSIEPLMSEVPKPDVSDVLFDILNIKTNLQDNDYPDNFKSTHNTPVTNPEMCSSKEKPMPQEKLGKLKSAKDLNNIDKASISKILDMKHTPTPKKTTLKKEDEDEEKTETTSTINTPLKDEQTSKEIARRATPTMGSINNQKTPSARVKTIKDKDDDDPCSTDYSDKDENKNKESCLYDGRDEKAKGLGEGLGNIAKKMEEPQQRQMPFMFPPQMNQMPFIPMPTTGWLPGLF